MYFRKENRVKDVKVRGKTQIFKWRGKSSPTFINGEDHRDLVEREGNNTIWFSLP